MIPPPLYDRHDDLAAQAAHELKRRIEMYPPLVERGTVTTEQAEADIATWRGIVSEWGGPAAGMVGSAEQLAAIHIARQRAGRKLASLHERLPAHEQYWITILPVQELANNFESGKAGRGMQLFLEAERRACLLDALAWWARPWMMPNGFRTYRAAINHLNAHLRAKFSRATTGAAA